MATNPNCTPASSNISGIGACCSPCGHCIEIERSVCEDPTGRGNGGFVFLGGSCSNTNCQQCYHDELCEFAGSFVPSDCAQNPTSCYGDGDPSTPDNDYVHGGDPSCLDGGGGGGGGVSGPTQPPCTTYWTVNTSLTVDRGDNSYKLDDLVPDNSEISFPSLRCHAEYHSSHGNSQCFRTFDPRRWWYPQGNRTIQSHLGGGLSTPITNFDCSYTSNNVHPNACVDSVLPCLGYVSNTDIFANAQPKRTNLLNEFRTIGGKTAYGNPSTFPPELKRSSLSPALWVPGNANLSESTWINSNLWAASNKIDLNHHGNIIENSISENNGPPMTMSCWIPCKVNWVNQATGKYYNIEDHPSSYDYVWVSKENLGTSLYQWGQISSIPAGFDYDDGIENNWYFIDPISGNTIAESSVFPPYDPYDPIDPMSEFIYWQKCSEGISPNHPDSPDRVLPTRVLAQCWNPDPDTGIGRTCCRDSTGACWEPPLLPQDYIFPTGSISANHTITGIPDNYPRNLSLNTTTFGSGSFICDPYDISPEYISDTDISDGLISAIDYFNIVCMGVKPEKEYLDDARNIFGFQPTQCTKPSGDPCECGPAQYDIVPTELCESPCQGTCAGYNEPALFSSFLVDPSGCTDANHVLSVSIPGFSGVFGTSLERTIPFTITQHQLDSFYAQSGINSSDVGKLKGMRIKLNGFNHPFAGVLFVIVRKTYTSTSQPAIPVQKEFVITQSSGYNDSGSCCPDLGEGYLAKHNGTYDITNACPTTNLFSTEHKEAYDGLITSPDNNTVDPGTYSPSLYQVDQTGSWNTSLSFITSGSGVNGAVPNSLNNLKTNASVGSSWELYFSGGATSFATFVVCGECNGNITESSVVSGAYSVSSVNIEFVFDNPSTPTEWCCNGGSCSEVSSGTCLPFGYSTQFECQENCTEYYCCHNGSCDQTYGNGICPVGVYHATLTQCDQQCGPGSCCTNYSCGDEPYEDCIDFGGVYYTDNTTCSSSCNLLGYCCETVGVNKQCNQKLQSQCTTGTWHPDINSCKSACSGYCCKSTNNIYSCPQSTLSTCTTLYSTSVQCSSGCKGVCCKPSTNMLCRSGTSLSSCLVGGTLYDNISVCNNNCMVHCCETGSCINETISSCASGQYYNTSPACTSGCQPVGFCCNNDETCSTTTQLLCGSGYFFGSSHTCPGDQVECGYGCCYNTTTAKYEDTILGLCHDTNDIFYPEWQCSLQPWISGACCSGGACVGGQSQISKFDCVENHGGIFTVGDMCNENYCESGICCENSAGDNEGEVCRDETGAECSGEFIQTELDCNTNSLFCHEYFCCEGSIGNETCTETRNFNITQSGSCSAGTTIRNTNSSSCSDQCDIGMCCLYDGIPIDGGLGQTRRGLCLIDAYVFLDGETDLSLCDWGSCCNGTTCTNQHKYSCTGKWDTKTCEELNTKYGSTNPCENKACCIDNACNPYTIQYCHSLGGIPHITHAICDKSCVESTCCGGSVCPDNEFDCLDSGGSYYTSGSCSECSISGACCTTGTCSTVSKVTCENGGGNFLGAATSCSSGTCDDGVCCTGETCNTSLRGECTLGIFFDSLTSCDQDPCKYVRCCIDSGGLGTCSDLNYNKQTCVNTGGTVLDLSTTTCDDCDRGICCDGTGGYTYNVIRSEQCTGTFYAYEDNSIPSWCDIGACCSGGSCSEDSLRKTCIDSTGTFHQNDVCSNVDCSLGICCDLSGAVPGNDAVVSINKTSSECQAGEMFIATGGNNNGECVVGVCCYNCTDTIDSLCSGEFHNTLGDTCDNSCQSGCCDGTGNWTLKSKTECDSSGGIFTNTTNTSLNNSYCSLSSYCKTAPDETCYKSTAYELINNLIPNFASITSDCTTFPTSCNIGSCCNNNGTQYPGTCVDTIRKNACTNFPSLYFNHNKSCAEVDCLTSTGCDGGTCRQNIAAEYFSDMDGYYTHQDSYNQGLCDIENPCLNGACCGGSSCLGDIVGLECGANNHYPLFSCTSHPCETVVCCTPVPYVITIAECQPGTQYFMGSDTSQCDYGICCISGICTEDYRGNCPTTFTNAVTCSDGNSSCDDGTCCNSTDQCSGGKRAECPSPSTFYTPNTNCTTGPCDRGICCDNTNTTHSVARRIECNITNPVIDIFYGYDDYDPDPDTNWCALGACCYHNGTSWDHIETTQTKCSTEYGGTFYLGANQSACSIGVCCVSGWCDISNGKLFAQGCSNFGGTHVAGTITCSDQCNTGVCCDSAGANHLSGVYANMCISPDTFLAGETNTTACEWGACCTDPTCTTPLDDCSCDDSIAGYGYRGRCNDIPGAVFYANKSCGSDQTNICRIAAYCTGEECTDEKRGEVTDDLTNFYPSWECADAKGNPCENGACCDAPCQDKTRASCSQPLFHGGAACSDPISPCSTGKCCTNTNCVSDTFETDCLNPQENFMSALTQCDSCGLSSNQPCCDVGVCCYSSGCMETTRYHCDSLSGTLYSSGSCSDNPSPCQTGACCWSSSSGSCSDDTTTYKAECDLNGFIFLGSSYMCSNDPCVIGYCCLYDSIDSCYSCVNKRKYECEDDPNYSSFDYNTCSTCPTPTCGVEYGLCYVKNPLEYNCYTCDDTITEQGVCSGQNTWISTSPGETCDSYSGAGALAISGKYECDSIYTCCNDIISGTQYETVPCSICTQTSAINCMVSGNTLNFNTYCTCTNTECVEVPPDTCCSSDCLTIKKVGAGFYGCCAEVTTSENILPPTCQCEQSNCGGCNGENNCAEILGFSSLVEYKHILLPDDFGGFECVFIQCGGENDPCFIYEECES